MTKTIQTPAQKLGITPQPARVAAPARTPSRTPARKPSKVEQFAKWRTAREQGNQVAGYDPASSVISNRLDVDVLNEIHGFVEQAITDILAAVAGQLEPGRQLNVDTVALLQNASFLNEELRKRKTAKQIAGQLYRS